MEYLRGFKLKKKKKIAKEKINKKKFENYTFKSRNIMVKTTEQKLKED